MEAHSYVHVKAIAPASSHIVKPDVQGTFASTVEMEVIAKDLETRLNSLSVAVRKLGISVSPWGVAKNSKRAILASNELCAGVPAIRSAMSATLKESEQAAAELVQLRQKLAEGEALSVQVQAANAQLQALASEQEAQLKQQASEIKTMLASMDRGEMAKKQAREEAGGRFDTKDKDTEEIKLQKLGNKVEVIMAENAELLAVNEQLQKSKADMAKKLKELGDKMRDEIEVRDRENRRLATELKKTTEQKETGMSAAKEQVASQLAARMSEIKALQRRVESAKIEVEAAKGGQKAAKVALDEVVAALGRSQEEGRLLGRKLADAKLQKEEVAREMEMAQKEQAMMHSELVATTRVAGPAAMTAISRPFYNAAAPWPRIAYTARGGKCLHNKACSAVDTNKCSPMEYHSHKELEACMAEGGMVLCHTCRADNGF